MILLGCTFDSCAQILLIDVVSGLFAEQKMISYPNAKTLAASFLLIAKKDFVLIMVEYVLVFC